MPRTMSAPQPERMPTYLAVLYIFGGVVWLLMGGDVLVRGAIALSRRLGISPLIVGLTVVAFGTSAPELVVSLRAALTGYPELSIANIVGSNIANVMLVVALPAVIYPMACDQRGVDGDARVMFLASLLFAGLCALGPLDRLDGVVLLAALVLFLLRAVRASTGDRAWVEEPEGWERVLGLPRTSTMIAVFLLLGVLALPLGADLLVRGAVAFADALGVPSAVVGLTIVAVGTSLPELATTIMAAWKRESALAVGNVIGSNVMNLLAIMGLTAMITPAAIPVPEGFIGFDLPVMLVAAAVLVWVTHRPGRVSRRLGLVLLTAYVAYTVALF